MDSKNNEMINLKLNRTRYWQVLLFFGTIFLHAIWWDLLLRKIPIIRIYVDNTFERRWRQIARRFRTIAVQMGGVLIKLGQFLSIRVDVLPPEIIIELAGLQDEVPPEPIENIYQIINEEFECSPHEIFADFNPEPLAAASLAQAHEARLKTGEKVVVKVQRLDIDVIVNTDLAAITIAVGWLKYYPNIAMRVDLDMLTDEFVTVTRKELDFVAEGHNAERLKVDFVDEPILYIPQVYWDYTRPRVLTLENVSYIRIADVDAIESAGINRTEVARNLYNIYMQQFFITNFVHADAHPGNLFVRALPRPDSLSPDAPTPFQIIFIDFGMVVTIPHRMRHALRTYAIGVGTRDAHLMVKAYHEAGALLPGADIKRLEEAHEVMFERFWGVGIGKIKDVALAEAEYFFNEYKDLIYEAPFQFQADMLFIVRAVGLLSGLATRLDPDFDPWTEMIPFAERLAREELQQDWQKNSQQLLKVFRILSELPLKIDKVFNQLQRKQLTIEMSFASDARKTIYRLEKSVNQLTWAVVSMGILLAGVWLRTIEGANSLNTSILILAGVLLIWKVMRIM